MSDRPRLSRVSFLILALLAALVFLPAASQAATSRPYQSSFATASPGNVAVDQATGDIYVVNTSNATSSISRFDSSGAPNDFTAGSNAGTNTLTGFKAPNSLPFNGSIAIDNSDGPLDGTIYVADPHNASGFSGEPNGQKVLVFDRSGAQLGVLTGSATQSGSFDNPQSVAVDQSTGDLYVGGSNSLWRYRPTFSGGSIDDADYSVTGISGIGVGGISKLAADSGNVYAADSAGTNTLNEYSASDFSATEPTDAGVPFDPGVYVTAVDVDPGTGDVYVDEGYRVSVFDSGGDLLYRFGAAADFGVSSGGIALKAAVSGPAATVYVSGSNRINSFGASTPTAVLSHPQLTAFGPSGGGATSFSSSSNPGQLGFDQAARRLYALDSGPPGIYGFDASNPPAYSPLSGFGPLSAAAPGFPAGLAVDNTSPSSTAGRLYLASASTDLLYGFDSTGTTLTGFNPLDPSANPGAPAGDPTSLCGAAADSAGDVWVSNSATDKILEYDSTGNYLGAVDTSAQGAPCQIALDPGASPGSDDLYAAIGSSGVWRYTAASSYATATKVDPNAAAGLAVDPSTHHLYVSHSGQITQTCSSSNCQVGWVDQWDASGNLVDELAVSGSGANFNGVTVDAANHYLYAASAGKVRVYPPGVAFPEATTKAATGLANASATLNGLAGNQAFAALSDCHFDYVTATAFKADVAAGGDGFGDLSSGGSKSCDQAPGSIPLDLDDHSVTATVTANLVKDTEYRFRLSTTSSAGTTASPAATFFTASAPSVETVGSPIRTATTARFDARIDPKRAETHYHFEYLTEADYAANGGGFSGSHAPTRAPANPADDPSAGDGNLIVLGPQQVSGLDSNTTYHYRAIADNGNPAGAAVGGGMTLTTFATDQPLSHGTYPGPPDSDRAWEQVSTPDASGNPVGTGIAFSDDGTRAIYKVNGGVPQGDTGGGFGQLFAQRPAGEHPTTGWQTTFPYPPRAQLGGAGWTFPAGPSDLSSWVSSNADAFFAQAGPHQVYRMHADGSPEQLLDVADLPAGASIAANQLTLASDDASRVVVELHGPADPNYPSATADNYYDVSSGPPKLLSLLPGNTVAPCGVSTQSNLFDPNAGQTLVFVPNRSPHWLSTDGSLFFFGSQGAGPCAAPSGGGPTQLYMRDIPAQSTTRISPAPVSGPDCGAAFVKWIPGSVFLWSQSRLSADDTAPASCGGAQSPDGDLYRYDLTGGGLDCLTCGLDPGTDADVIAATSGDGQYGPLGAIAIAADGSRLYFTSKAALLPGVPGAGQLNIYRLDLDTGALAYVASGAYAGEEPSGNTGAVNAVSSDGRFLVFESKDSSLNSLTGSDNGATSQLYRYDDDERSLICVSCPADGSAPAGALAGVSGSLIDAAPTSPNKTPLADDGTVLFTTPTALVPADQNSVSAGGDQTAATDAYEWRDGRLILVSDGLTSWPGQTSSPTVSGITPSGRDAFFSEPAQLTPDALDGANRLYDARIGGGIDFPPASLPPCDLNGGGCEGPGTNPPDQPGAGSAVFSGQGNPAAKFPKAKKKHHKAKKHKPRKHKHKAKKHHKRAKHNRRAGR